MPLSRPLLKPELALPLTPAESVFNALRVVLDNFQRDLDENHELGIVVPGAEPFRVERIQREAGLVLAFHGKTAAGQRATLLQHVSQTNVMLVALPKAGPVARRVGFEAP